MTTIVNAPRDREVVRETDSSGTGLLVGVIIALILIALFFVYGLPAIRNNAVPAAQPSSANINVTFPTPDNTGGNGVQN